MIRKLALASLLLAFAPAWAGVVGEVVEYQVDGQTYRGYLARDPVLPGQRPAVIVVHEWWGHNAYARQRADMLAAEGYLAFALDMYGQGQNTAHPKQAQAFMQAVTEKSGAVQRRFEAARALLAGRPDTDAQRIAAVGYCFGGGVVLNMARAGVDLAGVVSFHGSLGSEPDAPPAQTDVPMLVFNGEADPFVPPEQVQAFKQEMAQAPLTYIGYPGVVHSFTNPGATAVGQQFELPLRYDANADRDSWSRTLAWLDQQFWGQ